MPEKTDFNQLKCRVENNQLNIEAPVVEGLTFQNKFQLNTKNKMFSLIICLFSFQFIRNKSILQ
jgi:hypothetical protein